MLITLTSAIGIFFATYILTFFVANFLGIKGDVAASYLFKKDPFVYIFFLLLVFFGAIFFSTPYFHDIIVPPGFLWLGISFLFAGLIYFLFLLETDLLLDVAVFVFSVLSAFLFANKTALTDLAPVPWQLSALAIGLIIGLVTLGAKVLIGLSGVFSLVMATLSFGLFLVSCAGGAPLYLGLMALAISGIFTCVFRFNGWQLQLQINEGAVMSATFLFCMLLLCTANEFAAPSALILTLYIVAELLWSLFRQYVFRKKEPDLYFNSVYFSAFEKGTDLAVVYMLVLKICIVNIVLAVFQLYAQNAYTLPILALIIDFWFLSKISGIGQAEQSLKDVNEHFIQNIKSEIKDIKKHFSKKG